MGKTEFLRRDLLPAALERGYLVAYTNLWDCRSAPDTALLSALSDALEPQGVKAVLAKLGRPVKRLRASAAIPGMEGSFEAELAAAPKGDSATALREILKQLDRQKKPLLLAIDEAQVLARADHGDFAHTLRAALDVRKLRIKVIFAGSSETTLREMFARSSEPFYNWATLEPFPLLGDEFVSFTIKLMNSMIKSKLKVEQGKYAFEELHRTPEFFKRFIERYMLYQPQGMEAALAHTKASVFSDDHFLKQWRDMNPADQAVVTLLARGEADIHGAGSLAVLSAWLGKPATKNTVAHALRRLQAESIVTRLGVGHYRVEDEAFADWLRRRKQYP
ncbi:ATP-binding protein [Trinickia acidisoli]|uniref:ATP-binding protein n=1 Tax=Trinickia acidisoli TaxID=2767482 RepID=UPI001F5DFE5B|nr:ATP-binding protein [Trinickia acidisoli]